MKASIDLAAERDTATLPNLYPYAARDGVRLEGFRSVPAAALKVGDRIDLEGDRWADPSPDPVIGSEFQYELSIVHEVVQESTGSTLVHTSQTSVAFPFDHAVPVEVCDICEGLGYFTNPGPEGTDSLVVTRCDTCGRFDGDVEAAKHCAKVREWTYLATACRPDGNLASIEEGSVLVSDGEYAAFFWIAETIRSDDRHMADGYADIPESTRFTLERLRVKRGSP